MVARAEGRGEEVVPGASSIIRQTPRAPAASEVATSGSSSFEAV